MALTATACTPQHYGQGPITLSPQVQAGFEDYKRNPITTLDFAVSLDGEAYGYSYCPADHCSGNEIRIAIDACEQSARARGSVQPTCKTFAVGHRIVWDGPITWATSSAKPTQEALPKAEKQTRPIAVEWEGYKDLVAGHIEYETNGKQATIWATLPNNEGRCTGRSELTSRQQGIWSVACTNGLAASGSFEGFGAGKGASGVGIDTQGRKVRFTLGGAVR